MNTFLTHSFRWIYVVASIAVLSLVSGHPSYRLTVPNGDNVPHPCKPNYGWAGLGHESAGGGGPRNPFGLTLENSDHTWSSICHLDSDGDGRTNGQELGDPNCVWAEGDIPERVTGITHPGVCDPMNKTNCIGRNDWVDCSYDDFKCAVLNETETRNMTITFPRVKIPAQETTLLCMPYALPDDDAYHLVAVTPEIDNIEVAHHTLLFGCPDGAVDMSQSTPQDCSMLSGCATFILGWTVGISGICNAPMVGYAFGTHGFKTIVMQFHYNNPSLVDTYWDASGVTLHYTPVLRQYNAQMLNMAQWRLDIPPGQMSFPVTATCSADCTRTMFSEPIYLVTVFNHMHYLGRSAKTEHFRNGKKIGEIAVDSPYSYDSPVQHNYDPPIAVYPGDELKFTCEYQSTSRTTVTTFGEATNDEMCILFAVYYPNITKSADGVSCAQYQSLDMCKIVNPEFRESIIKGCNYRNFGNASHPDTAQMINKVLGSCPFSQCTDECKDIVDETKKHPCLHESTFGFFARGLYEEPRGQKFFEALTTCDNVSGSTQVFLSGILSLMVLTYNVIM